MSQLFDDIDEDHDGYLSSDEVARTLRRLDLPATKQILEEIFLKADTNHDNRLSRDEFFEYVVNRKLELRAAFDIIDVNMDGILIEAEIKRALDMLHLEASGDDLRNLIRKMSHDASRHITFNEFQDFLLLLPSNSLRQIFDHWAKSAAIDIGEDSTVPDDIVGGKPAFLVTFFSGGVAGAVSRTLTAPMDRVKTLMQAGLAKYTIKQNFINIYSEGGMVAYWRGNGSNVIKIVPESACKFVAYDYMKKKIASDPENIKVQERFIAGSCAGIISQTLIYPLEIAKTRIAVSSKGEYRGIIHCLLRTFKRDGILAWYRGLGASVSGIAPYAGIDLAMFMTMKEKWIESHPDNIQGPNAITLLSMGAISSTTGQIVAYPFQFVRTRLQTQGMNPNMPIRYEGAIDCLRQTVKSGGIRGLYQGILPNFMKTIPAVAISYLVYEKSHSLLS